MTGCQVFISNPKYVRPNYCAHRGVRPGKWAASPLKATVYRLCSIHKAQLERGTLCLTRK